MGSFHKLKCTNKITNLRKINFAITRINKAITHSGHIPHYICHINKHRQSERKPKFKAETDRLLHQRLLMTLKNKKIMKKLMVAIALFSFTALSFAATPTNTPAAMPQTATSTPAPAAKSQTAVNAKCSSHDQKAKKADVMSAKKVKDQKSSEKNKTASVKK